MRTYFSALILVSSFFVVTTYACKHGDFNNKSGVKISYDTSAECNDALSVPEGLIFTKLAGNTPEEKQAISEINNKLVSELCGGSNSFNLPPLKITPTNEKNDVEERRALCVELSERFNQVPASKIATWVAQSAGSITMSCHSFEKGGFAHYGQKAFLQIMKIYLAAQSKTVKDFNAGSSHVCKASKGPDISFLRFANANVASAVDKNLSQKSYAERIATLDNHFMIRGISFDFRTSDVVQAIPLSDEEISFIKQEWPDGTIFVKDVPKEKAIMSYDVNPPGKVYGKFAFHVDPRDLCKFLNRWQGKVTKLEAIPTANEAEYITQVAILQRECVAIHPFADGNGRTCSLWGVTALGRRGIPSALMWPSEDYSISALEFSNRIRAAVENNKNWLKANAMEFH